MAFQCGFFNSINGDRKYNAEQMNNPYSRIISNGVFGSAESSTDFQVISNTEMNVIVKQGQGMFDNKWAVLDADLPMTVPTPHVSMTRIDSIIIRVDNSDDVRAGSIEYKQGIPDTSPVPVELENTVDVKEYRLAKITVQPNVTEITQANIYDCRPTSECGFIHNLLWDSDMTATYKQWQTQFDEWFNVSKNEFIESQEQNQNDFDAWFTNVKETLTTATLISSFTSRYVTTEQDETIIPINIPRYNSVLDILQVYINGLICIKDVDYTLDNFNNIVLSNGVDIGTEISFICYKSVDGSEAESVVGIVNSLYQENEQQKERIKTLENKVEQLESKTDEALWVGANLMGQGETITPSKPLSQCKNGWLLCWCDYDNATNLSSDTQFVFTYVPKNILKNINYDYVATYFTICTAINDNGTYTETVKRLTYNDTQIVGFVGNTATADGNDVCLKAIYEF